MKEKRNNNFIIPLRLIKIFSSVLMVLVFFNSIVFAQDFTYTGAYQTYSVTTSGIYSLEVWGAQGGDAKCNPPEGSGGKGGHSTGSVYLSAGTTLYIGVGGKGKKGDGTGDEITVKGGWNRRRRWYWR